MPSAAAAPPDQASREGNWLVGEQGEVNGQTFYVGTRTVTIGRGVQNFIQLTNTDASRVHCQIRPTPQGMLVTDLRSFNGTLVNGERVRQHLLQAGDRIQVGKAAFVYQAHAAFETDHGLTKKQTGPLQAVETNMATLVQPARARTYAADGKRQNETNGALSVNARETPVEPNVVPVRKAYGQAREQQQASEQQQAKGQQQAKEHEQAVGRKPVGGEPRRDAPQQATRDPGRRPDVEGDFKRYPFPRLLFYLHKKQFLGQLEVRQLDGVEGSIYFRSGSPVFADLSFSEDVLGRVLLEKDLITEEAYERSLRELAAGGRPQGQILLGMGALDGNALLEGLRVQLLRKLIRLFQRSDTAFSLHGGDHDHGRDDEDPRVDPLCAIYHGVRNTFDAGQMKPELDKLRGAVMSLPSTFLKNITRYEMEDEMHDVVAALMRDPVSIDRLCGIGGHDPMAIRKLVYILWVTEALVVARPGKKLDRLPVAHPADRSSAVKTQAGRAVQASTPRVEPAAPAVFALTIPADHHPARVQQPRRSRTSEPGIEETHPTPPDVRSGGPDLLPPAPVSDSDYRLEADDLDAFFHIQVVDIDDGPVATRSRKRTWLLLAILALVVVLGAGAAAYHFFFRG